MVSLSNHHDEALSPWRLCRNVILRHQPKNLGFLTYGFYEILHGVYPEPKTETLHFAQVDTWRRVQNDKKGVLESFGTASCPYFPSQIGWT